MYVCTRHTSKAFIHSNVKTLCYSISDYDLPSLSEPAPPVPEVPPPELEPEVPPPVSVPSGGGSNGSVGTGSNAGPQRHGAGASLVRYSGGTSRDHLDESPAGVRARVLRRMERPHSMVDTPVLPQLWDLVMSHAYSADAQRDAGEPFSGPHSAARNRSIKELKRGGGVPRGGHVSFGRRAISLADFLFRRKGSTRPARADSAHVIANPMHAPLPFDEPPPEGAAHPV